MATRRSERLRSGTKKTGGEEVQEQPQRKKVKASAQDEAHPVKSKRKANKTEQLQTPEVHSQTEQSQAKNDAKEPDTKESGVKEPETKISETKCSKAKEPNVEAKEPIGTTARPEAKTEESRSKAETEPEAASNEEPKVKAKEPKTKKKACAGVVWEWESDGGWTKFQDTLNTQISGGFCKGDSEVVLQVSPGVKVRVEFSSMMQYNVSTGWGRAVRCAPLKSSLTVQGKWEWQDEHEKWNPYTPAVQRLLTACQLCGVGQWEIKAAGRPYKVEIGHDKDGCGQQTNLDTGVQRRVRYSEGKNGVEGTAGEGVAKSGRRKKASKPEAGTNGSRSVAVGIEAKKEEEGIEAKKEEEGIKAKKEEEGIKAKKEEEGIEAKKEEEGVEAKKEEEPKNTSEVEDTDSHVLVTYRGKVPVDYECHQKVGKAHVFSEDGAHWDATLNQTNLKNNNNKFYILQLLKENTANKYSVWFRWGRVGKAGQHSLTECGSDLQQAKSLFTKKFSDKTYNSWDARESFVKHAGKYDLLSMDYSTKEETDAGSVDEVDGGGDSSTHTPPEPVASKLDRRLQSLIELICDVQAMEDTVLEMKYDAKKAPLGKLTPDQVRSGYAALKAIEECINRNNFGDALVRACDQFYTRIPHCFGMQRPPIIKTKQEVKEKIVLLETLSDIQVALKVLRGGDKEREENPIDHHYRGLNCTLTPVDHEDEVFGMVEKYVCQTHARTHSQYRLEVQEVFTVARQGEAEQFKDVGNRQLLWHGSRLTNWVGILSQGLRVAPPEAPVTGYMFGKGVYFADMCSKSANYCFASRAKSDALALLCDVSLGKCQDLLAANYSADQLPKGKFSTKGLGKVAPDPAQTITQSDGCVVPLGTPINTGVINPSGYTLNYNEFIVYDPKQIKMKYLVKLKFHFN